MSDDSTPAPAAQASPVNPRPRHADAEQAVPQAPDRRPPSSVSWCRSPPGASWSWSTTSSRRCTCTCPAGSATRPRPTGGRCRCSLLPGCSIALAVVRLPGRGGHEPADGFKAGAPTKPIDLPGIVLAALASVGLGMVLGPEAPLIALGTGLAVFAVKLSAEGHARSGHRPPGCRRGLRGHLLALRLADRRGDHHHRGHGARRARRCRSSCSPASCPRGSARWCSSAWARPPG